MQGDEDRLWDDEEGIYPSLSRDGTLTSMIDSSWMDECMTPSTYPGTPDVMQELPSQQPSAVERLSASGQVGLSPGGSRNEMLKHGWNGLLKIPSGPLIIRTFDPSHVLDSIKDRLYLKLYTNPYYIVDINVNV